MLYTNGTVGICVASKCGSQTLSHAAPDNGWWELGKNGATDRDTLRGLTHVICITRHPMIRMLSAWRMYFVRPAVAFNNHLDWNKVYKHLNADMALPWVKRHRADIFVHPVLSFHKFLRRNLDAWLAVQDPHFMSMSSHYRPLEEFTTVVYRSDFDRVQEEQGWESQHRHHGEWEWQYVTPEDFLVDAPELEHLQDDWRIYDK